MDNNQKLALLDLLCGDTSCKKEEVSCPFSVGEKWLFRTVTNYVLGQVLSFSDGFIELGTASWVADTGRFCDALTSGELSEVEPAKCRVVLNVASVVDAYEWSHDLPTQQK